MTDCHGWLASWDPRGLRMTHGNNSLVLGVPTNFAEYVSTAPASTNVGVSV